MIAWLLFNALEIATSGISTYRAIVSSSSTGKMMARTFKIAFNILDSTISSLITTLVGTMSWVLGKPVRSSRATRLKKGSTRFYSMREVPWKRGVMKRISLLAFASNTIGSALMRKRHLRGSIHGFHAFITNTKAKSKRMAFDTDSFPIKIDNCCTCCISPNMGDFIGPVQVVTDKAVQSFNGQVTPVRHMGTIRWMIDDDQGVAREIIIPNLYHIPTAPHRMLSPQHWAQQADDNTPEPRGTWCAAYPGEIVLQWCQRQHTRTVKLDPRKGNTGTLWSSPGYNKYVSKLPINDEPTCYAIDGSGSEEEEEGPEEPDEMHELAEDSTKQQFMRQNPLVTDFKLNGPKTASINTKSTDEYKLDPSAVMLQWHHRLSHISMRRIQLMAKRGQLPKRLATCRVPLCQSCLYGKAVRRRWRDKPKTTTQDGNQASTTRPGQCVSVDQLESTTLGFFWQLKGRITTAKYRAATIFVDHYSDLTYVHLQQTTSAKETLEAKNAFELYAKTFAVSITHYHADNGRFAENVWRNDIINKGQHLTFCGVGAHH
jgi:GAG-pre-integrase domain